MKEDPIKNLIKESRLETSKDFTDSLMQELERRIQQKMKVRLYLLITSVVILFACIIFVLISWEFKLDVFGLMISLPKIVTMVLISMTGYFILLHLWILLKLGDIRQANNT